MLVLISQLVGRPLVAFSEAEDLCVIGEPIIEPKNGKLAGFHLKSGLLRQQTLVVPAAAIVSYESDRLVAQIDSPAELQLDAHKRLAKIVDQKIAVLNAKVITESGRRLGKATDLLLDTDLEMIVRYYVHGLLQDRIIAAEHVNRIERRGIIVDDAAPAATGLIEAETTG